MCENAWILIISRTIKEVCGCNRKQTFSQRSLASNGEASMLIFGSFQADFLKGGAVNNNEINNQLIKQLTIKQFELFNYY